jgi:transposase-like protein
MTHNGHKDGEIMNKEPIIRYNQAFKQQVVREYEAGASIYQLRQKYGIGGYQTVKRWIGLPATGLIWSSSRQSMISWPSKR